MTSKAEFNAEEWDDVLKGPAVAGLMVIAADRGGTIRESVAMGKAYQEAQQDATTGDLLGEIAGSAPHLDKGELGTAGQLETRGPELIGNAVRLIQAKATDEEVDEFKRFCLTVAEHAAQATKSGGFLGIGGKRISEAESNTLDQIAGTLGLDRLRSGPATAD